MAGLNITIPSGEVSLAAGTAKTVVTAKAPSNQRLVFSPAGLNAPFQLALGLGEQRIWVKGGGMGGMTVEKRQE